jgi:hypothetical protein
MPIKPSGELTMAEINAEFGLGNSLSAYRGVTWWTSGGATGTFSSTNIKYSDFYGKQKAAPSYEVTYFVAGSGGGGGGQFWDGIQYAGSGGGGGSGGYLNGSVVLAKGNVLSISVGAGGPGGSYNSDNASNGSPSSCNGQTATGGGRGGWGFTPPGGTGGTPNGVAGSPGTFGGFNSVPGGANGTGYGNGGNGGGNSAGYPGGDGAVILTIPTAFYSGVYSGPCSVSSNGTSTILTFTPGSGSYTA